MLSYLALFFSFIALASSVPVERSKRETRLYSEESFSPSHEDFLNYFVGNATEIAKDELFPPRKEKNEVAEEKEKKILETFGKSVRGVHHKMTDKDLVALSGILREALYMKRQELQKVTPVIDTPSEKKQEDVKQPEKEGEKGNNGSGPEPESSNTSVDVQPEPQQAGESGNTNKNSTIEKQPSETGDGNNNNVTPQPAEVTSPTPPKEGESSSSQGQGTGGGAQPTENQDEAGKDKQPTVTGTSDETQTDTNAAPEKAAEKTEVSSESSPSSQDQPNGGGVAPAQEPPKDTPTTSEAVTTDSQSTPTPAVPAEGATKRKKREAETLPTDHSNGKDQPAEGTAKVATASSNDEEEDDFSKIYRVILHDFYPKEPLKDKGQFFAVIQRVFNVVRSYGDRERAAKILAMYYVQLKKEQFS